MIINPNSSCSDIVQKIIPYENDAITDSAFIPNIFTPNGDGNNDYLEIIDVDNLCEDVNIIILNRWGKKFLRLKEANLKWGGTNNESTLHERVYFYIFGKEKGLKRQVASYY